MPSRLRDAKRELVRTTIIDAARSLIAERGFDAVTVADIADRAGVGRATFFRYFPDKVEVVFATDARLVVAEMTRAALVPESPVDTWPGALNHVRSLVLGYVAVLAELGPDYALHQRLVAEHPELHARHLVKLNAHAATLTDVLRSAGAQDPLARLAAEVGIACYLVGSELAQDRADRLVAGVETAFDLLS